MARKSLDLNVSSPYEVPAVLERAAQEYWESAGEVESAWQDPGAGRPWRRIARILDRAAIQVRKAIRR